MKWRWGIPPLLAGIIPSIDDLLNGVNYGVLMIVYNYTRMFTMLVWMIDKLLLLLAYIVQAMRYWMSYNMFAPLIIATSVSLQAVFSWVVWFAISILAVTYLLAVFAKIKVVEAKSAVMWLVIGTLFFQGSGYLYYGFEQMRATIGSFFYQQTVGAILCGTMAGSGPGMVSGTGGCGAMGVDGKSTTKINAVLGGLVDKSNFGMTQLCDNFGPYIQSNIDPNYTWSLSALDVSMAYFRADPMDITGSPVPIGMTAATPCDGTADKHANNLAAGDTTALLPLPWSWTQNHIAGSWTYKTPGGTVTPMNDDTGASDFSTLYMQGSGCLTALKWIDKGATDIYKGGYFNYLKSPLVFAGGLPAPTPWFAGQKCDEQPLSYDAAYGMREESVNQGIAGLVRAVFGIPLALFSLLEQITYLLLTSAFAVAFLLMYIALFFALFKKTEPIAMAVINQFIGIIVMTTALSVISAIVVGFYALAATQASAIVASGLGFFAVCFGIMMVLTGAKVLVGAANSVFDAIGQASGVSGFGMGDMAKIGGVLATGGVGALALAATSASVMGNDSLDAGQKAAAIGGAAFGGNQSLVGAARMLGRVSGADETGLGNFANDFVASSEMKAIGGAMGMGAASSLMIATPAFSNMQAASGENREMRADERETKVAAWREKKAMQDDASDAYDGGGSFWQKSAGGASGTGRKAMGIVEPEWNTTAFGGETYSWVGENGVAQTVARRNGTDANSAKNAAESATDEQYLVPSVRGIVGNQGQTGDESASTEELEIEAALQAAGGYVPTRSSGGGDSNGTSEAASTTATAAAQTASGAVSAAASLTSGGAEAGAAMARGSSTLVEAGLRLASNLTGLNIASPQGMIANQTFGVQPAERGLLGSGLGAKPEVNNGAIVMGGAYERLQSQGVTQKDGTYSVQQVKESVLKEGGMVAANDGKSAIQGGTLPFAQVMNDANQLGMSGKQVEKAFDEVHSSRNGKLSPETRDTLVQQASRNEGTEPAKAQAMVAKLEADMGALPTAIRLHGVLTGVEPLSGGTPPVIATPLPPTPPPSTPLSGAPSPTSSGVPGGSLEGSGMGAADAPAPRARSMAAEAFRGAQSSMNMSPENFDASVHDVVTTGAISEPTRKAIVQNAVTSGRTPEQAVQQVETHLPEFQQQLVEYVPVARAARATASVNAPSNGAGTGGVLESASSADSSQRASRSDVASGGGIGGGLVTAYARMSDGTAGSATDAVAETLSFADAETQAQATRVLREAGRMHVSPATLGLVVADLGTITEGRGAELSSDTQRRLSHDIEAGFEIDWAGTGRTKAPGAAEAAARDLVRDVERLNGMTVAGQGSPAAAVQTGSASDFNRGTARQISDSGDVSGVESIASAAASDVMVQRLAMESIMGLTEVRRAMPVVESQAASASAETPPVRSSGAMSEANEVGGARNGADASETRGAAGGPPSAARRPASVDENQRMSQPVQVVPVETNGEPKTSTPFAASEERVSMRPTLAQTQAGTAAFQADGRDALDSMTDSNRTGNAQPTTTDAVFAQQPSRVGSDVRPTAPSVNVNASSVDGPGQVQSERRQSETVGMDQGSSLPPPVPTISAASDGGPTQPRPDRRQVEPTGVQQGSPVSPVDVQPSAVTTAAVAKPTSGNDKNGSAKPSPAGLDADRLRTSLSAYDQGQSGKADPTANAEARNHAANKPSDQRDDVPPAPANGLKPGRVRRP